MKTFLFLVWVIACVLQANAQASFSKKYLTISTSTVQSWSPGAVQTSEKVAGGVIYQIQAVCRKSGELKFDSLFVDGKRLAVEVAKGNERAYQGPFKKGDSIALLARQDKGVSYQKISTRVSHIISSKKDAAFISIWVKDKHYLQPVSEFKKKSGHSSNQ